MKNKRAEQAADKKRHREQLKSNRKVAPRLERPKPHLVEKETFLIVCEGSKMISSKLFQLLESEDAKLKKNRRTLALERAKRNHRSHRHNNDALMESNTTVYLLVEELLKFL